LAEIKSAIQEEVKRSILSFHNFKDPVLPCVFVRSAHG
jgi:hypothetical protein